jgi:hypothetical protein
MCKGNTEETYFKFEPNERMEVAVPGIPALRTKIIEWAFLANLRPFLNFKQDKLEAFKSSVIQ